MLLRTGACSQPEEIRKLCCRGPGTEMQDIIKIKVLSRLVKSKGGRPIAKSIRNMVASNLAELKIVQA